jgi:hypothetical protein
VQPFDAVSLHPSTRARLCHVAGKVPVIPLELPVNDNPMAASAALVVDIEITKSTTRRTSLCS